MLTPADDAGNRRPAVVWLEIGEAAAGGVRGVGLPTAPAGQEEAARAALRGQGEVWRPRVRLE